jgi:alpha-tubulin suppressor-like RCC1 family protein
MIMKVNRQNVVIYILILGLLISGCGPARIVPLVPLAAGGNHTCALTSSGGVKCWGDDYYGELGDTTAQLYSQFTPVDVVGLTDRVTAIVAGGFHTCALTLGGGVKCWGDNDRGQLGDGTTISRRVPVDVIGLTSGIVAISAGAEYTCALTSEGGVKCWGDNEFGYLGDGTTTNRDTPVDVITLTSGVVAISAGYSHTCAVTSGGGVKCWGINMDGELGDGTRDIQLTPVDVIGLTSGVSAITLGAFHTCALTSDGGVKCWGFNADSELGDGTTVERTGVVDVIGLTSGVVAISSGFGQTCALTTAGGVKCWGQNYEGELGDGSTIGRALSVEVKGLAGGVVAISAGWAHTCAMMSDGRVKCWGYNNYGVIGDGTTTQRLTPVDVKP